MNPLDEPMIVVPVKPGVVRKPLSVAELKRAAEKVKPNHG